MDLRVRFIAVTHESHDFLVFSEGFCHLAVTCPYDDKTLKSLFWIKENYNHLVDLPDTTRLNWKEAINQYLESVFPRSRKQPDPELESPLLTWRICVSPPQMESCHPPRSVSQSLRGRGQSWPSPRKWSSIVSLTRGVDPWHQRMRE